MKKYGVTKAFPIPLFLAVVADDASQSISFAMYQASPLAPDRALQPWAFGARECLSPNGKAALQLLDTLVFRPTEIENVLAPKEIAPYNNVYFCMESWGKFNRPFNKMMESYGGKEPGGLYLRRSSQSCFAQLLIPFPDSKWEDMALRLTVNQEAGYWLDLGGVPVQVENTNEAYSAFAAEIFPSIEATLQEVTVGKDQTQGLTFTVKPAKEGVRIYLKSDAGYMPLTECLTDAQGVATARISTRDMLEGEQATVEAGFKWVSNMARTVVKVA